MRRRQHRRAGDEASQQMAAAVTHEDGCGMNIEDQESRADARHRRGHQGEVIRVRWVPEKEEHHEKAGRNRRDAAGQAVDVVEQIEGVGDADNPGDGQEDVDGQHRGDRHGTRDIDKEDRGQHLAEQLCHWSSRVEVVDQADREHRAAEQQQLPDRPEIAGQSDDHEQRHEQGEAPALGHRGRALVPPVGGRPGVNAVTHARPARQGHQQEGGREATQEHSQQYRG